MEKKFNDFLSTLTPEVLNNIERAINKNDIIIELPKENDNSISFSNGLAQMNIAITLELLKLYHNWLNS